MVIVHSNTISVNVLLPSLLLGKSKSGKNKVVAAANECEHDKLYSKHTLKAAYDLPYAALFSDTKSQSKFEASAVTIVNGSVCIPYVIHHIQSQIYIRLDTIFGTECSNWKPY